MATEHNADIYLYALQSPVKCHQSA